MVLMVDGVNEVDDDLRERLLNDLIGLHLRSRLAVMITSRHLYQKLRLLRPVEVEVSLPTDDQCRSLASAYGVSDAVLKEWWIILKCPLDFKLAAEVESTARSSETEYSFLHAYIERKVCGNPNATPALMRLAWRMSEQLSWSLPTPEVTRIIREQSHDEELLPFLCRRSILTQYRGRVSFWHEKFQHYFLAENLLSGSDLSWLATELGRPRHRDVVGLVIGALEDTRYLRECLRAASSEHLFLVALKGELGIRARGVAEVEVRRVFAEAETELSRIQVAWDEGERSNLYGFSVKGVEERSTFDLQLLLTLGRLMKEGPYLADGLRLLEDSETKCVSALGGSVGVSSRAYAAVLPYLVVGMASDRLAVCFLFANSVSGLGTWQGIGRKDLLERLGRLDKQSPALLYLLCNFCRSEIWANRERIIESIEGLLLRCKEWDIYHLTLEAAVLAREVGMQEVGASVRIRIAETLRSMLSNDVILNSMLLEALTFYESVDVGVTQASADREVVESLEGRRTAAKCGAASACYFKQFEDIYQDLYAEAVGRLGPDEVVEFHVRVALGVSRYRMLLSSVLESLIDSGYEGATAAFEKWSQPPMMDGIIDGDVGGVFLLAHLGLARLRQAMPQATEGQDLTTAAWREWGKVLYWCNRTDLEKAERNSRCSSSWKELRSRLLKQSIDPLHWISRYLRSSWPGRMDLLRRIGFVAPEELFPDEMRHLLEESLGVVDGWVGVFPTLGSERLLSVISYLGQVGHHSSAVLLETLADSPDVGQDVILAIRAIRAVVEER